MPLTAPTTAHNVVNPAPEKVQTLTGILGDSGHIHPAAWKTPTKPASVATAEGDTDMTVHQYSSTFAIERTARA